MVALLQGGTSANGPSAMQTATRLACMQNTKDVAVVFVKLLLCYGAEPGTAELQDEIQGVAEKWWIQATWKSAGEFCRILRLLVDSGLNEHVVREVLAVLGLDDGFMATDSTTLSEVRIPTGAQQG